MASSSWTMSYMTVKYTVSFSQKTMQQILKIFKYKNTRLDFSATGQWRRLSSSKLSQGTHINRLLE